MRSNCRLCKAFVRVELHPFAVAQLRLLAEMQALTKPFSKKASAPEVNLFITNTLDNPFVEEEQLQNIVEAVARSRPVVPPVRYASRSFDRQWIIPDHRLLSMARPRLWGVLSDTQLFLTAIDDFSPTSGPAVSFTCLVPDQHHYHGRGGRVYPLWADAKTMQCNVRAGALELLAESYGAPVSAEDVFAYIAAIIAHPAFTTRFATDLVRPGLRLPLTAVDGRAKPGHDRRNRGAFRPAPHPVLAAMPVKLGRTSPSAQQGPLGNKQAQSLFVV
jgi:hypothetical protein